MGGSNLWPYIPEAMFGSLLLLIAIVVAVDVIAVVWRRLRRAVLSRRYRRKY